jgi:hypothetical protein
MVKGRKQLPEDQGMNVDLENELIGHFRTGLDMLAALRQQGASPLVIMQVEHVLEEAQLALSKGLAGDLMELARLALQRGDPAAAEKLAQCAHDVAVSYQAGPEAFLPAVQAARDLLGSEHAKLRRYAQRI